jgi:hypothetical protein
VDEVHGRRQADGKFARIGDCGLGRSAEIGGNDDPFDRTGHHILLRRGGAYRRTREEFLDPRVICGCRRRDSRGKL